MRRTMKTYNLVATLIMLSDVLAVLTCLSRSLQPKPTDFTLVASQLTDDQPDPAEEFTVVRVSENRIALKTGYGRYVSVNSGGELVGRMEAIGPRETWEPVFEDGKLALCACTHRFMNAVKGQKVMAASEKAVDNEIFKVYCDLSSFKTEKSKEELEEELASSDLRGFESNYVKKFQSGKKVSVCSDSRGVLKKAKVSGKLHEALLDRREKMKADRYCK